MESIHTGSSISRVMVPDNQLLIKLFGSTSRAKILDLLSSHPSQSLYQREVMSETGLSLQAVQRELGNLVGLGILKTRRVRHRVYYQVNPASLFLSPLKQICESGRKE
jgi:predicted transcriptional regulator